MSDGSIVIDTRMDNSGVEKGARNLKKTLENTAQKAKDVGTKMTGMVTAPMVAGLIGTVKGTEDLRQALGRLDTNAQVAGISTDKMRDSLVRLSGITEDTDANVEALSNLLATGFDEQGLTTAMDALSGAVVAFPDTLKIEGLADGLQETLATGKAIGPFAEMLERMKVDLDSFDEGLQKATESGKEQNYILDVLAKTGLAEVNEAYRENNEELIEAREANAKFMFAMGQLGGALSPILTTITTALTGLVEKFNEMDPAGQKMVIIIGAIIAILPPLILLAGSLGLAIMGISWPILAVIAGIAALIAIGVLLWQNWDTIKSKTVEIWGSIKEFFIELWTSIKEQFQQSILLLRVAITTAWNTIKSITSSVWNGIKDFFSGIWNGITSGVERFKNTFLSVWGAIKDGVRNFINPIIGFINTLITGIEKMVNAIASGVNSLPTFDIPDWVPGIGGGEFGLPDIPKISLPRVPSLNIGTDLVTRSGLAMIHEGEKIVPAEHNGAYTGKGEGKIHLEVIYNVDSEEIFRIVEPHMDTSLSDKMTFEAYLRGQN